MFGDLKNESALKPLPEECGPWDVFLLVFPSPCTPSLPVRRDGLRDAAQR